jgi:hypothetical protein
MLNCKDCNPQEVQAMVCRSLVTELRGAVLAHSLASLVGCSHALSGYGLGVWGAGWAQKHSPCLGPSNALNAKWGRALNGSTLRQPWLDRLFADFPPLLQTWNDPLWRVLEMLWGQRCCTDSLALSLRLNGMPGLPAHGAAAMRRLCACPDWHNLGYALALLGSQSPRLAPYRHWLRAHFLTFLLLLSIAEPLCHVRGRLYLLLDALLERGALATVDDWPVNGDELESACQQLKEQGATLQIGAGLDGWDIRQCTLMSLSLGQSGQSPLVQDLAGRADAALQRHAQDHFSFGVLAPRM